MQTLIAFSFIPDVPASTCVCWYTWRPKIDIRYVPQVIFHWIFQDSLVISLELTSSALLAGWKASGSSCPLSHHRDYRCLQPLPAFYIGAGDLNSRPHAGIASTLPTEPSSWPLSFVYLFVCLLCFCGCYFGLFCFLFVVLLFFVLIFVFLR